MPVSTAKSRPVRLFVSLAVSIGLHAAILSVTPGLPAWRSSGPPGSEMAATPLAVHLVQARPVPHPPVRPASNSPVRRSEPASESEPIARRDAAEAAAPAVSPSPAGMFPGPWYYPARYLHRRPTPLKPIWPEYPETLEKLQGRVRILLLINEEGYVDQHRIEASDPPEIFDASVIAAFTAARYAPALIAGYKVKSQLLAEISFEPGAPPRADFSIMGTAGPIQLPASSLGREN